MCRLFGALAIATWVGQSAGDPVSKIAFASDRNGNVEIYVMDADGSNPVNLTNHPAAGTYPSWLPDVMKTLIDSKSWGRVKAGFGGD